jgi:hypothetical protein
VFELHLVQGGPDNGDKEELRKSAKSGISIPEWVLPKHAQINDEIVVYISGDGFFATARVASEALPRPEWPNRYCATLSKIALIEPAISLPAIRRHLPRLRWANYPRSIHTVSAVVAPAVRQLIAERRRTGLPDLDDHSLESASLAELRAVAVRSARKLPPTVTAQTIVRARCLAIAKYVQARAGGVCEGCRTQAPFRTKEGTPFLEVHHIKRLADEGPDHPANAAALCPNCHRKAHHASDAAQFNRRLLASVALLEKRPRY